jgi:hypothetical protein
MYSGEEKKGGVVGCGCCDIDVGMIRNALIPTYNVIELRQSRPQ